MQCGCAEQGFVIFDVSLQERAEALCAGAVEDSIALSLRIASCEWAALKVRCGGDEENYGVGRVDHKFFGFGMEPAFFREHKHFAGEPDLVGVVRTFAEDQAVGACRSDREIGRPVHAGAKTDLSRMIGYEPHDDDLI